MWGGMPGLCILFIKGGRSSRGKPPCGGGGPRLEYIPGGESPRLPKYGGNGGPWSRNAELEG